jgi:hypothetical protein
MGNCEKCGLALGVSACLFCLGAGGAYEFKRPSDIACSSPPPAHYDFGPSPGCDDGTLPHNRPGWLNSYVVGATGPSSTVSGALFTYVPMVAFTAHDAEDAAEPTGRASVVVTLDPNGASMASITEHGRMIVHPNEDERLALIRQSNNGEA